ncbi:hypothetical protein ASG17_07720 [Brevundimonas sp. Leaf363]|uniref:hypothetical protein n=1 Tax=Brevundimonas sp. Leaf363 TaxID=1736353 RepID=UPI0006F2C3F0|nr:hypothetical protein [Brevundimonas sp. Leaf363]KQS55930.1 hypothetical protein ASG17_07720 [Brevundimonas sp. Leaf363]
MTRMLAQGALINAAVAYDVIVQIERLAAAGHQDEAWQAFGNLAHFARSELPVVKGVVAAQQQAAEALDLTQRTLAPFFPRKAEEHPHAANDHPTNPVLPSPTVA